MLKNMGPEKGMQIFKTDWIDVVKTMLEVGKVFNGGPYSAAGVEQRIESKYVDEITVTVVELYNS